MKRVLRSWRKLVSALLVSVLLTVLLFLVWTNVFYFSQNNRQLRELYENALTLWINTTESRLATIDEHIREILLTVYNNTVVTDENAVLSFRAEYECKSAIEDKLQISSDADCFFILDTRTDKLLFRANSGLFNQKVLSLKQYAQSEMQTFVTGLHDNTWYVTKIGQEVCFIKSILMGKYSVGSICRVSNFDFQEILLAMEEENSLLLISREQQLFAGGSADWTGEIETDGKGQFVSQKDRLLVSVDFPVIDGSIVLAVQRSPLFGKDNRFVGVALVVASLICFILMIALITVLRKKVETPVRYLLNAQEEIGGGNIQYRIEQEPGSTEFARLFESFNSMVEQIQNLRIESYDKTVREQENRLRMVRAQLKPHFYLNAITTVSNMTYQNRLEDIRAFVLALGKHMRYMMNVQSEMVPASEELDHIVNYLEMQQIRFPGSVDYSIECVEDAKEVRIPFLVLFTLVENAFKHALDLYQPLLLKISCRPIRRENFQGYCLAVEDNGDGFPKEVLDAFQAEFPEGKLPSKEHLGLTNIRYTLRYSYQEQALLRLSNTEIGARAEIWIPDYEESEREGGK